MPFTSVTTFKEIADSFREIQLSGNRGTVKPSKISISFMGPHYIDYINNGGELKLELVFNEKVTLTDNDFKLDEELGATINIDKLETNNGGLNWTVTLSVADETIKDTEYTLGLTEKFLKKLSKEGPCEVTFDIETLLPTVTLSIYQFDPTYVYQNDTQPKVILTFNKNLDIISNQLDSSWIEGFLNLKTNEIKNIVYGEKTVTFDLVLPKDQNTSIGITVKKNITDKFQNSNLIDQTIKITYDTRRAEIIGLIPN